MVSVFVEKVMQPAAQLLPVVHVHSLAHTPMQSRGTTPTDQSSRQC